MSETALTQEEESFPPTKEQGSKPSSLPILSRLLEA